MRFARAALPIVTLGTLFLARESAAQLPSIDARTWRPSGDPRAGLVLEPTTTQGAGIFNIGAYVNYTLYPITLKTADGSKVLSRPVEHLVGMDLILGVGIGSRLAIGLTAPIALYQTGTSGLPNTVATTPVATTTMGDLGAFAKVSILDNANGGVGLATIVNATLPTGDSSSFMSDAGPTVGVRALLEWSLVIAGLQMSAGYKLRFDNQTWPDAHAGGVTFGGEIPWTIGVWLKPDIFHIDRDNRQKWELAFHGSLPGGPVGPFGSGDPGSARLSPALVSLSDRIGLGHYQDSFFTIGAETSLTEAIGAPAFRFIVGAGWAPREHDKDHDGIPDDQDQCEDIPEDKDGFEDSDGCPEIDNDDDGVIDREDACPNVAGERSTDPKKNGCPAPVSDSKPVDTDGDGIPDSVDKCPTTPEDKDGNADEDGCPDPDDDGDGILDAVDACPKVPGEASSNPAFNGCPNADRDGDTYLNDADMCPDSAEVFNGIKDEDGCPDDGGKALVTLDEKHNTLRLLSPIKLILADSAPSVDASSQMTLRALAMELNHHSAWTLAVGARPSSLGSHDSLERAMAVVHALSQFAPRNASFETVGWEAVRSQPGSESGIGFLLLVKQSAGSAPLPVEKER